MAAWSACGPNAVGVVHTALLCEDGMCTKYAGLQWRAPWHVSAGTAVTFRGAAVTDNGFGPHATSFTMRKPRGMLARLPPAPVVTNVIQLGTDMFVFFDDLTKVLRADANGAWKADRFLVSVMVDSGVNPTWTNPARPAPTFTITSDSSDAPAQQSPVKFVLPPALIQDLVGEASLLIEVRATAVSASGATSLPTSTRGFAFTLRSAAMASTVGHIVRVGDELCQENTRVAMDRLRFGMDADQDNGCAFKAEKLYAIGIQGN